MLENKLLSVAEVEKSSDILPGQPWVGTGAATTTSSTKTSGGANVRGKKKTIMRLAAVGTALSALLYAL